MGVRRLSFWVALLLTIHLTTAQQYPLHVRSPGARRLQQTTTGLTWLGTPPFCIPLSQTVQACQDQGLTYVRQDPRGDGALCLTGVKVLCSGTILPPPGAVLVPAPAPLPTIPGLLPFPVPALIPAPAPAPKRAPVPAPAPLNISLSVIPLANASITNASVPAPAPVLAPAPALIPPIPTVAPAPVPTLKGSAVAPSPQSTIGLIGPSLLTPPPQSTTPPPGVVASPPVSQSAPPGSAQRGGSGAPVVASLTTVMGSDAACGPSVLWAVVFGLGALVYVL